MHRPLRRTAIAAAALAAATGFTATTATATTAPADPPTWTISPGGDMTGTAESLRFVIDGFPSAVVCESSTATGTTRAGSGQSGEGIGQGDSIVMSGCGVEGLDIPMEVLVTGGPWSFNAAEVDPANPDRVLGALKGIRATVRSLSPNLRCSLEVAGPGSASQPATLDGFFDNSTSQLGTETGGNLRVQNAACGSLIENGDQVFWDATYTVSPPMTITPDSP